MRKAITTIGVLSAVVLGYKTWDFVSTGPQLGVVALSVSIALAAARILVIVARTRTPAMRRVNIVVGSIYALIAPFIAIHLMAPTIVARAAADRLRPLYDDQRTYFVVANARLIETLSEQHRRARCGDQAEENAPAAASAACANLERRLKTYLAMSVPPLPKEPDAAVGAIQRMFERNCVVHVDALRLNIDLPAPHLAPFTPPEDDTLSLVRDTLAHVALSLQALGIVLLLLIPDLLTSLLEIA